MPTIPQTLRHAKRLTAVIVAATNTRTSVAYITEARATELYIAGDLALVERGQGDYVYALRSASVEGLR